MVSEATSAYPSENPWSVRAAGALVRSDARYMLAQAMVSRAVLDESCWPSWKREGECGASLEPT
jgi:hypothetical protein